MTTTTRRMLLGLTAAVLALGFAGCSSSDGTYLPALKADAMASWQPDDAELLRKSEQGYDQGGATSKQTLAQVTRTFRLPSAAQARQAQQSALRFARSQAGWQVDELGRDGFLQRPGPAGGSMTLSVLPSVTDNNELIVQLTAP